MCYLHCVNELLFRSPLWLHFFDSITHHSNGSIFLLTRSRDLNGAGQSIPFDGCHVTCCGAHEFFFCGIFIPVTDLPNLVQPIIEAIPLTVAVQAARAIALSTGNPYLWQNLAYIIAFTIPVFLIGLHLFKKKVIT